jgi:hypothetical protein
LLLCSSPCSLFPAPPSDTVYIYAHRSDGSWLGFGRNDHGQLGVGGALDRSSPIAITPLGTGTVESCALGYEHTICKKYVCVLFLSLSLALALALFLSLVQDFIDGSGFSRCAALVVCCCCALRLLSLLPPLPLRTRVYMYAHRNDGSWLGFGSDGSGQLGVGDTLSWNYPTAITALGTGTVESCALGRSHTICKKYVCMFFLSLSCRTLLMDLVSHAVLLLCAAAVLFSFSLSPAPPFGHACICKQERWLMARLRSE